MSDFRGPKLERVEAESEVSRREGARADPFREQPITAATCPACSGTKKDQHVSEFSTRTLDHDGEVQAALVVAQLERRRPHAFAHSRRVANLSVRVAQLARLRESEIRQVYWGALVHDIGELDVPEPIFDQHGPLATIERRNVDLHPEIGSRWLATTPGLSSLVPYARWHHERFDGKG
jgi:HD-GYP domain-containing protein (c-di-GMP phosphodiesterase class II)